MFNFNFLVGFVGAFSLLLHVPIQAEDYSHLNFEQLMQVEVISVSKKSENLTGAAAAVYVVTEEEIRRTGATSIPEALRLVPGVDVAQIDANKWSVGIRGFGGRFANKLLVLIDGRSVYTPTYSGVYWEYFDYLMDDIKRIEVIRGPGATLWGTNAVNGVINVITREAGENPGGVVSLAAGNEYQGVGLRQGGDISDNAQMRAYVKGKRLDESDDLTGKGQANDGEYLQTGLRLDLQLDEQRWITLQGDLYQNEVGQQIPLPNFEIPYGNRDVNDTTDAKGGNLFVNFGMLTGYDSELDMKLTYDFYDHQEISYGDRRDTYNVELQHQFSPFTNHDLVWGAGYRLSENDFTATDYVVMADSSNKVWNFFAQDTILFPKNDISLTLGIKLEDNNYGGSELQPSIRASWLANEKLTWWGAVSHAMRTPSLTDTQSTINTSLDYPTLVVLVGNEDFKSEQLDAYELGMRWNPSPQLSFDIATFYNNYSNMRSYTMGDVYSEGEFIILPLEFVNNIDGHSHGVEFLVNWQASPHSHFRFTYSWLDIDLEDENGSDQNSISLYEDRSLEHQVSLWGGFDLSENVELDVRLYYTSKRSWNENSIDPTINANLNLGWQVTDSFDLALVGNNLLHTSAQQYIAESCSASALERSIFLKGNLRW